MDAIDVVMPLEEGRHIPQAVLEGLCRQDIPFRLWVSTRFKDGQFADACNQVKRYGQSAYVLMLDNDIALPPDSLRQMTDFLDAYENYGAIALCKHPNLRFESDEAWLHAYHVDMSCVLFRKEVLDGITFVDHRNAANIGRAQLAGACECANACADIRRMELEIGFLPNVYAAHLHHARVVATWR